MKLTMLQACNAHVAMYVVPAHACPRWFTQEVCHFRSCIFSKRCRSIKSHSTSQLQHCSLLNIISTYDYVCPNVLLKNLVYSQHSNPKSLFKHLYFLSTPEEFSQMWINTSQAIYKLLDKAELSVSTSNLYSLLLILYFHL